MSRVQLEVCVETVADAVAAEAGGADRLELCADLSVGGLTPAVELYQRVRAAVRLPTVVMIRPRAGDFVYTREERHRMTVTLDEYRRRSPRPDGFVFGVTTSDGRIDGAAAACLVRSCGPVPAIFHRAFDEVEDKAAGLDELIRLGFARVLTSGGPGGVPDHLPTLKRLVERASGRIQVMPGGGVRAETAGGVVQFTRCEHLHGSFSEPDGRGRRTSRAVVAAARAAVDHPGGTGGPMASG
jgi:copper homeostasis protein